MSNRPRKMDPEGKRLAVMAAGERLFASHGYGGTTMADIARTADVAVGSLYRLFPDKPALLAALHQAMEERFIAAMSAAWHSVQVYADRFDPMIDALMATAEVQREVMPLYALTRDLLDTDTFQPGHAMIEAIAGQYREGQKAGAYRKGDARLTAFIAHGMVEGGLRAWMADPTPRNRSRVARQLKDLFRHAFVIPDGA